MTDDYDVSWKEKYEKAQVKIRALLEICNDDLNKKLTANRRRNENSDL